MLQLTPENKSKSGTVVEPASPSMVAQVDEELRDMTEVLSRLAKSTARIKRYWLIFFGAFGIWFVVKLVALSDLEWRREFVARHWSMAVTLSMFSIAYFAIWRLRSGRSGEEQKRALEEMLQQSETDPLAFESELPQLRRLSRRFSPTYERNHEIAGEIVERVEQARAQARGLPIAHQAAAEKEDDLPRPA